MTFRTHTLAAAAACFIAGCAAPLPTTNPAELKGPRPGVVPGYLAANEVLDGVTILPPPPAAGSPAQAADEAAYRAAIAAQGSPRWQQAILDAEERDIGKAMANFACALGAEIRPAAMPHLTMLVRRTMTDIGVAYDKGKDHYQRQRPFAAMNGPNCTPDVKTNHPQRSYPSGHAAVGWGVALVLTEVAPDRATALARRGRDFAYSRVACGVHWPSDVDAGRDVGAAVVAQLHANADFRAQLAEARKEVAAARAANSTPSAQRCSAEAAALSS